MNLHRIVKRALLPLVTLLLSACISAGPEYVPPQIDAVQDRFVAAQDPLYRSPPEDDVPPWWVRAFEDPRLDELMRLAQANNRELAQSLANLQAAEARLRAARRSFLPQGDVEAAYQRQDSALGYGSPGGLGGTTTPGDSDSGSGQGAGQGAGQTPTGGTQVSAGAIDLYTLSANLAWEIDLFGRVRRQVQQADASSDYAAALAADTRRMITARMAEAYFDWLEACARQQIAADNLAAQRGALELTEAMFRLGENAEFDVERQRTQTRSTEAALVQLTASRAEALSAIAVLAGRTVPDLLETMPSLADLATLPEIPAMEPTLALSDPESVLRRRPDVAAAERDLAAATYAIGVQAAELFPQLTLSGSASQTALERDQLFDDDAFGYSLGVSLSWSVFSIPRLLALVDAEEAEAAAALASYGQTVLTALTETDSALVSYSVSLRRAELLEDAYASAARSLVLAEARYRAGADSLLSFLDSQRTALDTQDQYVAALVGARRARVAVHRALAQ